MTPQQQDLVQSSFAKVAPIADTAASIFYERLFVLEPRLRQMFPEDMAGQRQKLMATLGFAITHLKNWHQASAAVRQLGLRHVKYGVKERQYETVGTALIEALAIGLGDAFTPEVEEAWLACYALVASEMKQAACSA